VGGAPQVDRSRSPGERDADGIVEAAGQPERAREIPARATGDHGQLDLLALCDAVHDLVHGAIAADDDQELGSIVARPPCETA
jgi:hypothetical protein